MRDFPSSSSIRPPHEERFTPPDRIGPYRILQLLGEGGMGVVYEAEQTVPIHRRVALKVVRAEVATREVLARFDAERQALAVMTHESIAKVLDGGTSDTGQPFFVMELVRGMPITDYCDAQNLTTRERIGLFIPVCRAVQHAHQKGVIHRDLKPSNVLVAEADGKPLPKIIDFGVAKAVGQQLTERTLVTMFGQALGTPAYMSPEQAGMSGLDVDTRTDIYSLGVLLYELLVGRLPEDPEKLGLPGFMARLAMREIDAPTPSTMLLSLERERDVLARLRRTDWDSLRRQLHGDLDWIVMKAMEKDRNRRYETANGLALDLTRYLADEPVQARPPTPTYRVRKFVRRHRLGVVSAAAVAIVILIGGVTTAVGFFRAVRAEERAREEASTALEVSAFLTGLFKVADPSSGRGNAITAREILDSGAKKIETDLTGQPVVQARLMNTIGDVYAALGLYPQAERLLQQALASRERLSGARGAEVADNLTSLGSLYISQGRYPQAETTLKHAALLVGRSSGPDDSRSLGSVKALAVLYREQGRYAESDSMSLRALAILERSLGPEHPDVASQMQLLASSRAERGRLVEAESLFRRVLRIKERAYGAAHPKVAAAYGNLASSLYEQGKLTEAEALYRRDLAIVEKAYGPNNPDVALVLYNVASVESDKGRRPEAIALYERARAIWERSLSPNHPYVAAALTATSNVYSQEGRYAEALPLLQRALTIREKTLTPGHPFIGTTHHELGVAYRHLRRFPAAEEHLRRALEIRQKSLEPTSFYTALTFGELGSLYQDESRYDESETMYRRAVEQWDRSGHARDADWKEMERAYGALLRRLGRVSEAAALEQRNKSAR